MAFIILLVCSCNGQGDYSYKVNAALKELDSCMEQKETYRENKVRQITYLKDRLHKGMSDEDLYSLYDKIYDEYYQYNIDSAIFYVKAKYDLAIAGGGSQPQV